MKPFFSWFVFLAFGVSLAWTARAEAAESFTLQRPITYASVEVNPLAVLAHRYGGQVQVGLAGPISIVGSAIYLHDPNDRRYSAYEERMFGNMSLTGWTFELGPRVFAELKTPAQYPRMHVFVQPSLLIDRLHEGDDLVCRKGSSTCDYVEGRDIHRNGIALDVGATVTSRQGFYALAGVGYGAYFGGPPFWGRSTGSPVFIDRDTFDPTIIQRGHKSVRLLLAVGFGF